VIVLHASGTLSTTGSSTEDTLGSATVEGKFRLEVDLNDMVAGDVIEVKIYKIILTSGTKRLFRYWQLAGAPDTDKIIFTSTEEWNDLGDANSLQFTVTQKFGSAGISLPWKILREKNLAPTTDGRTLAIESDGMAHADVKEVAGTTQTAGDIIGDTNDIQARLPAALTSDGNIKADALRWAGALTATDDIALKASLAKGTDITGFNDLSAAQVNAEADTALADVGVTTTVTGRIDAAVSTRATQASVDTIDALVDAIKASTDNLPSDPADQSLIIAATDAIMTRLGMPANADIAADIAAVLVAVGTRLAASSYTAPDNSGIADIKTQTDRLTFDADDNLAANIKAVNDIAVGGSGTEVDPWGPA
jgi:hypothetical protein